MARTAWRAGRCYREVPVAFRADDGVVIEGQADLAFEADDGWVVVDFKTGLEIEADPVRHRRQVGIYARAVAAATQKPARGVLLAL
jgi:ATP-dependent exoDNAse (exonuclease V) beta subunit